MTYRSPLVSSAYRVLEGVAGGGRLKGPIVIGFSLALALLRARASPIDERLGPVKVTTLGGAFHCSQISLAVGGYGCRPLFAVPRTGAVNMRIDPDFSPATGHVAGFFIGAAGLSGVGAVKNLLGNRDHRPLVSWTLLLTLRAAMSGGFLFALRGAWRGGAL